MLNRGYRILGIADDMTGALEVGAKLSQLGSSVTPTTSFGFSQEQRVVVLDAETRHIPGPEARAKIYEVAKAARQRQIEIIYKKTDSTLRGNVGPEICAIADAFPEKAVIFVPAYPGLGRTVRRGCLYVDGEPVHRTAFGRDELNPVRASHVPDAFVECGYALCLHESPVGRLTPHRIHVFDSETEADVAAVVTLGLAESSLPIFCGPGSVAGHLAAALGCSERHPDLPAVTSGMVVNGSRHEVGMRQISDALKRGWPLLSAKEMSSRTETGWAVLSVDGDAHRTGQVVRSVLSKTRIDCLVVFGGDTAYTILRSLATFPVIPVGELFPGIPVSRVGELQMITKAGGFGPVDFLSKISDVLSRGS